MDAITPNWIAIAALLAWPMLVAWLYLTQPVGQATLWAILGAEMLLPVGAFIKLAPGIPNLDRVSIPNIAALLGCTLLAGRRIRFWSGLGLTELLLAMIAVGPFITSELNGDPITIGRTFLPALDHYEALSAVVNQFLLLLPFLLGRQILRSTDDNAQIMRILVIAGLLYSLPILFEIRFSPQLNFWIYGYFPSGFDQEIRNGGFRAVVFMGHGLGVAFFAMTTVVAATACWRAGIRIHRLPPAGVTAYLSTILILCKSMGALTYGAALVPLVRWAKPQLQMRVAVILVAIALLYPALRLADLVPTTTILQLASSVSVERASSLQTRFDQEQQLLAHATDRLLFGWGRFGRSRVYDAAGRDISITDGAWIITLGQFGLFGFLAEFGLLVLPVFRAASALRFAESVRDGVLLGALALILAVNVLDLIPNSGLMPWTWLLAGALLGRAETLHGAARRRRPASISPTDAYANETISNQSSAARS